MGRVARQVAVVVHGIVGAVLLPCGAAQADPNPALPPLAGGVFIGQGASALATSNSTGGTYGGGLMAAGAFQLTYDPLSSNYAIAYDQASRTNPTVLGPAQLRSATATTETYSNAEYSAGLQSYQPPQDKEYVELTVLKNRSGSSTINLSYTSYAVGLDSFNCCSGSSYNDGAFGGVFGQVTPAAALPRSGSAYYTGIVDGYLNTFRLSGSGELLANFYTGEIATGLNLYFGSSFYGRVDGRGNLASGGSAFAGALFGSGNNQLGRFTGSLFGPAYQEAGYGFEIVSANTIAAGAFVGSQATPPAGGIARALPPASTGANASLIGLSASDTFATSASTLLVNPADYARASGYSRVSTAVAKQLDYGTLTIAYDAATSSYILKDDLRTTTFAQSDRHGNSPINTEYSTNFLSIGSLTSIEQLSLFTSGPGNPYLQLTYLSYGLWTNEGSFGAQNSYRAFIFGLETPIAGLPRSGAALYNGAVDGYWGEDTGVYRLQGSDGSILANFYTGEVRTTMRLAAAGTLTAGAPTPIRVDGFGSIAANSVHFGGMASTADGAFSGTFQGAFYGPAAIEAGLTFALRGATSTSSVSGVLVAKQVPLH